MLGKARVTAVLLAAGGAKRFGSPKQLAEFGGRTLARRAAETACASRCAEVVAVVGHAAEAVAAQFAGLPMRAVENPRWEEGLASSIRTGVAAVGPEAEALFLLMCDQPLVTAAHLDRLVGTFEEAAARAVASGYDGHLGPPALFARPLFQELMALRGDEGARSLLRRHRTRVVSVSFPPGGLDVDRPEDLLNILEIKGNHA